MENRININGTWYVREGLEKVTTQEQAIEYLQDLTDREFVNVIKQSVNVPLKRGYLDNHDLINGDISLAQRQLLAIFLVVNN